VPLNLHLNNPVLPQSYGHREIGGHFSFPKKISKGLKYKMKKIFLNKISFNLSALSEVAIAILVERSETGYAVLGDVNYL
jgi:hypothetical protein